MSESSASASLSQRASRGFAALRRSVFWGAAMRQSNWLLASVALAIASALVGNLTASATAAIIDEGVVQRTRPLGELAMRLVVLAIFGLATGLASRMVGARIGYTLELDLRNLLYLRLQRARPSELDGVPTGQVITRALEDLEQLENFIQTVLSWLFFGPFLVGLYVYLLVSSPVMALVLGFGLLVNGLLVNRIRRRLWGLSYLQLDQRARITAAFDEPLRGIRVVKSFAREREACDSVAAASAHAYRYSLSRERYRARYDVLFKLTPMLLRFALLIIAARLVVGGSLTIGQFTVLNTYILLFSGVAEAFDAIVSIFQYTKTGAGRLTEILRFGPRRRRERWERLPESRDGVVLDGAAVRFGDVIAVPPTSVHVPPGSVVVVTGPPGSGKSLLAGLAAGVLVPSEGSVRLDGVELARLDPNELREAVHLVSEEAFLFGRTLRDNLLMGVSAYTDPGTSVDDAALHAAIEAAGAADVLASFAAGLDTVIGDRGLTLSGGQRQRLALARALVTPPRLLVLDDALSAISPAHEIEIVSRIREFAPEMAILCIGRRASLRAVADHVVDLPSPAATPQSEVPLARAAGLLDARVAVQLDQPYDARLTRIVGDIPLDDDTPKVSREAAERDQRVSLLSMIRPLAGLVSVVTVLVIAYEAVNLVPEYLLGNAANHIEAAAQASDAGARRAGLAASDRVAVGVLAVAGAAAALTYLRRINQAKVSQSMLYFLRLRLFRRLTRLGLDYYDREMPGAVSTRVVEDIGRVERFADELLPNLARPFVRLVLTTAIVAILAPSIVPIVVAFAVVATLATFAQLPLANRAYRRERAALGDLVTRLQEDFAGRYVISGFAAERRARAQFGELNRTHRDAQRTAAVVRFTYSEGLDVVRNLAAALVLYRAGNLALAGAVTTGTVITLNLYLREMFGPIPTLASLWQGWLRTRVSLEQLNRAFDEPVLPARRAQEKVVDELEGEVEFDSVSFRYPGTGRPVLAGVSFTIVPGDRVAIVGPTGAGKSSIAKLLARMYDPDAGAVRVDGGDIRDLDLPTFRRRLGVVPQDAFLFRGTVASNIAYGKPDASREEMELAAIRTGAYEVLSALDGGLDARVEEEGRNLTAGERQLVALARALLADPDVLVLDEATASLDATTEATVLDAILSLGRTTILVTHRVEVAARADLAILVHEGRIVEAGAHESLLAAEGHYAGLWAPDSPRTPAVAGARRSGGRPAATASDHAGRRPGAQRTGTGQAASRKQAGVRKPKRASTTRAAPPLIELTGEVVDVELGELSEPAELNPGSRQEQ